MCSAERTTGAPLIRLDGAGWGFAGPVGFDGHQAALTAWHPGEVANAIAAAEAAAAAGLHLVGFISYEAASAINPILPAKAPLPGLPLAWFASFREVAAIPCASDTCPPLPLSPAQTLTEYRRDARKVLDYISAGDCYQINLTFPLTGQTASPPLSLYCGMIKSQPPPYAAYIDTGEFAILSLSPELFFRRHQEEIETRPMKGTALRGRFPAEDRLLADRLKESPKERAENLMIVDLLRNDLGMVAEIGTVRVPELFTLESYPTVHQMTSTISAGVKPERSLAELLAALFPCGSVTGAPKRRSMEIIAELENRPRGVYCGAIGYLAPGGKTTFSVAIRTLLADHVKQQTILGVGSGITADSSHADEYRECLAKGAFASTPLPAVGLIESLRLENGTYPRRERHLHRLTWSAGRLGMPCDRGEAERLLDTESRKPGIRKVRLHLDRTGTLSVGSAPLQDEPSPLLLALDNDHPAEPDDLLLFLKTDCRERYEAARARHPDVDEVLLLNSRGELTEGSYNSLVLKINGEMITPPLASGLLPGILREELLERGELAERVLYPADLWQAEEIWLINSVRGRRRGKMTGGYPC
ncbi:aminodeoxychorismate synthase component 1 [Geobacter sp. OR-1]|uniref:aminodeoxychorismate synthase component I n=1 Tax=Geobacter sp. OR-1 TaxID=1266765 RepID=UPI0005431029|nr:aminodeoxychorismate synthase component I [Geobacter sp. OR-1]GAM08662.1 aminodeoxychorismate synthase component 1 [Geobacter sp. OR-1]